MSEAYTPFSLYTDLIEIHNHLQPRCLARRSHGPNGKAAFKIRGPMAKGSQVHAYGHLLSKPELPAKL